jgi:hypothetical protein
MEWTLNPLRREILKDDHRFKVVVAGRRFGKTYLALMWLCLGEIEANERRWFIAPTYRQGKMIAFPVLRQIFRDRAKVNESELKVTLSNGAEICIKGADNEDSLRGAGLNRVVLDEYAMFKNHVWQEIVLPMLATTQGDAMFIGTPDGYNSLYDLYLKGQSDPEWMSWQYTTIEGGFVEDSEIDRLKSNMDGRLYRQEMEASFETTGNRAAYNFDRDIHIKKADGLTTERFIGMDFNVDYMSAVIACVYTDGTIHYYDEIRQSNSNTEAMSREMRKRWGLYPIFPDPAGKARSTTSNRSDHQILKDNGFQVIARVAHPTQKDRLSALNRMLLDAKDRVKMTIDPSCKYLIKDLEQTQRDKKGGISKKDDAMTHFLDACSYYIELKHPIVQRVGTSVAWN